MGDHVIFRFWRFSQGLGSNATERSNVMGIDLVLVDGAEFLGFEPEEASLTSDREMSYDV
jgi:hypothetical protein